MTLLSPLKLINYWAMLPKVKSICRLRKWLIVFLQSLKPMLVKSQLMESPQSVSANCLTQYANEHLLWRHSKIGLMWTIFFKQSEGLKFHKMQFKLLQKKENILPFLISVKTVFKTNRVQRLNQQMTKVKYQVLADIEVSRIKWIQWNLW